MIHKADCQISEPVGKMSELEQNHFSQQLKLELSRTTEPSKMLQAYWLGNTILLFTLCTEVSSEVSSWSILCPWLRRENRSDSQWRRERDS